jgi:hypothetical protein
VSLSRASRTNESNDSRPYYSTESEQSDVATYHIEIASHSFAMTFINNRRFIAMRYMLCGKQRK